MGPRGLSSFVVGVGILELNSPLLLLLLFFFFGVFVCSGEIKNVGNVGRGFRDLEVVFLGYFFIG